MKKIIGNYGVNVKNYLIERIEKRAQLSLPACLPDTIVSYLPILSTLSVLFYIIAVFSR